MPFGRFKKNYMIAFMVIRYKEEERMKKAILATKVGMTQIFNEDGQLIPVTVLQAGPCVVTQVKTEENDGYAAVQVGYGEIREKLVNKPEKGHFEQSWCCSKEICKRIQI